MALIYQKAQREDQGGANSEHKQSGFPALGRSLHKMILKDRDMKQ